MAACVYRDDDGNVYQNRPQYKSAFGKIRSMENYLAARQVHERRTLGHTHSDDEEDEVDQPMRSDGPSSSKGQRKTKSFFSRLRKVRFVSYQ